MPVGTGNLECDANPFTMIWCALWELVERNENLTDLLRLANRIDYINNPPKENINTGDLPELALVSDGGTINLKNSSSATLINRKYNWMITTGEWQINSYFNIVSFELIRAMVDYDSVLCSLVWPHVNGRTFVGRANVMSIEEGTTMLNETRGIRGWAGVLSIDIDLHLRTDDLRII